VFVSCFHTLCVAALQTGGLFHVTLTGRLARHHGRSLSASSHALVSPVIVNPLTSSIMPAAPYYRICHCKKIKGYHRQATDSMNMHAMVSS